MPLTGLFQLPLAPNATSPTTAILSHITLNFPCSPLPVFSVAHHLFASTSSLLPNPENKVPRQFCQLVTISHSPDTTYVGTTSPKAGSNSSSDLSQITIPATSAETFAQFLNSKLQPLWSHRQTMAVENGTSISLRDGQFILRVGDLKQAARVANAPTALRGVVFEVCFADEDGEIGADGSEEDNTMLRAFLEKLLGGTTLKLDGLRLMSRYTDKLAVQDLSPEGEMNIRQWALAGLYMEMLRARG